MVPLASSVSVGGIPIGQLLAAARIEALVARPRPGGGEIVSLLKEGSAYYAPSSAVAQMCESIVRDKKRVLPCSVWLEGEYGLEDIFMGVPCKLGRDGLEGIYEVELTVSEMAALESSAAEVRETMSTL